jgi:hypothetical protein
MSCHGQRGCRADACIGRTPAMGQRLPLRHIASASGVADDMSRRSTRQPWANNGLSRCTPALLNPPEGGRGWRNAADSLAPGNGAAELIAGLSSFAWTQELDE